MLRIDYYLRDVYRGRVSASAVFRVRAADRTATGLRLTFESSVSKSRKKAKGQASKAVPRESPKSAAARQPTGAIREGTWVSFLGLVRAKRPVLGFVLLFAVLMAVFYSITFIPYVSNDLLPAYTRLNARMSVGVLNLFGEGATAKGTAVSSTRFSVDIRHGCDAVAPSALFIAAVLAFPGSLRSKIPGILVGTLVLAVINIIRIVTLFYTGIFFPRAFEAMHVDVWQPIFILLALIFWVIWAWWATRPKAAKPHVTTEKA